MPANPSVRGCVRKVVKMSTSSHMPTYSDFLTADMPRYSDDDIVNMPTYSDFLTAEVF